MPNAAPQPITRFIDVDGHRLETLDIPALANGPPLLFMHEGLGSVALWRDFPARVATATGCRTVVYSRYGHGRSSPRNAPYEVDFMHTEALVALPQLRAQLGLAAPLLIGHSTGASMALIHAGDGRWPVAGVLAMAPLLFVEDFNLDSIRAAGDTYRTTDLRARLARYHEDVDGVFWGWNEVWLNPRFKDFDIRDFLPAIRCPVIAMLGDRDEYSTRHQVEPIARLVDGAEVIHVPDCGHSPHRDRPEVVLQAITRMLAALG